MRYISPFKLFPSIDFSRQAPDSISYPKLKRKLLAEFELNDNQPLDIGGESIGKSEALRLLDSLKEETVLKEHLNIAKDKELLLFIEGRSSDYIENPYNKRKQISDLIAEEFVEQYDNVLSRAFQKSNKKVLMQVLAFPIQEVVSCERSPYEGVFRKLKNEVANLEDLSNKTGKEQEKEIKQIQDDFTQQRLMMINALPIDFLHIRNQLGGVLIGIAASIYNDRQNGYLAGKVFRFVEHLECDEEYRELAAENFTIVKGENTSRYDDKSGWKWSWWQIVGIVILSVRLLHYCSSSSSSDSDRFDHIEFSETLANIEAPRVNKCSYVEEVTKRVTNFKYNTAVKEESKEGIFNGLMLMQKGKAISLDKHKTQYACNLSDEPVVVGVFKTTYELENRYNNVKQVESSAWYYVMPRDTFRVLGSGFSEIVFLKGDGWGKSNYLSTIAKRDELYTKQKAMFFTKDIHVVQNVDRRTSIIGLNDTTFHYEVGEAPEPN